MTDFEDEFPAPAKGFSPVDPKTGRRLELEIEADVEIPRGRTWERTILDLKSGLYYRAWNKACLSPGCQCDAYAELHPTRNEIDPPLTQYAVWCECGGDQSDAVYAPDGRCACGTWKHHYHCLRCRCICQTG